MWWHQWCCYWAECSLEPCLTNWMPLESFAYGARNHFEMFYSSLKPSLNLPCSSIKLITFVLSIEFHVTPRAYALSLYLYFNWTFSPFRRIFRCKGIQNIQFQLEIPMKNNHFQTFVHSIMKSSQHFYLIIMSPGRNSRIKKHFLFWKCLFRRPVHCYMVIYLLCTRFTLHERRAWVGWLVGFPLNAINMFKWNCEEQYRNH